MVYEVCIGVMCENKLRCRLQTCTVRINCEKAAPRPRETGTVNRLKKKLGEEKSAYLCVMHIYALVAMLKIVDLHMPNFRKPER